MQTLLIKHCIDYFLSGTFVLLPIHATFLQAKLKLHHFLFAKNVEEVTFSLSLLRPETAVDAQALVS